MLRDALECGLGWLRAAQLPDGSWPDFVVAPTAEGREWPTGYITAILAELPLLRQPPWVPMLSRARAFLRTCARPTGGWGFNATTPIDADSTAWCLLALVSSKEGRAEDSGAELRELRQHQDDETGGFRTYRHENAPGFPEASGYCAPTPCVTAAVLQALDTLASAEDAPRIERALGYLWRSREEDGSWRSFWWEPGIYSTAMVVRLLARLGQPHRREMSSTRAWLERRQLPDGSWSGRSSGEPNPDPFLTALALGALLDLDVAPDAPSIRRGRAWLMDAQRDEGSWEAPPILKLPVLEEPWRPDMPYTGLVVAGQRRSFVTATVISTLARFAQPAPKARWRIGGEPPLRDASLDDEVGAVVASFDLHVDGLPEHLSVLARTNPSWHRRGAGLSHYLPFWLDVALADGRMRGAARQMALANRFGQFFCLLRDAVIDRNAFEPATVLLPGDALFFQFIHRYQMLFPAGEPFWKYFERYWTEYLNALAWEQRCRRRPRRYDRGDAAWWARKLSPIKICCAGMALLAQRVEILPSLEALVDDLHIGWQLWDDLQDWEEDLSQGHWTWPLALARERLHGAPSVAEVERQLRHEGVARTVIDVAIEHLERASHQAEQLNLPALGDWIERFIRHARAMVVDDRGVATEAGPLLKLVRDEETSTVLNVSTGALFSVDLEVGAVIERLAAGNWRPVTGEEIAIVDELRGAGVLGTAPPPTRMANPRVHTLFLKTSAGAPHHCFSCVGTPGKRHRAPAAHPDAQLRAIESLLQLSPSSQVANLVFICDVQTSSAPLISLVISQARARAESLGKTIDFHLVGDVLAADLEAITAVSRNGGSVCLTRNLIHDEWELDRVLDSLGRLRRLGVERLGANVGLHNYEGRPADVLARLDEIGLDLIGLQSRRTRPADASAGMSTVAVEATQSDFTKLVHRFERALAAGRVVPLIDVLYPLKQVYGREGKAAHCGAGATMTSLAPDGSLFPCFRFSDMPALELGDGDPIGWPQALDVYQRTTVDDRDHCRTCWARYLCGGGCLDNHLRSNGNVLLPDPMECALITHRFEEIIKLAARIPSHLPRLAERLDTNALVTFLPEPR